MTSAAFLLAAGAALAAGQPEAKPAPAEDHRVVADCNAAAARRPLSGGAAARCSAAYERLLAHYGGYAAYVEARRARERRAR